MMHVLKRYNRFSHCLMWRPAGAQITTHLLIEHLSFLQTTFPDMIMIFSLILTHFACTESNVEDEINVDPYLSADLVPISDGECPDMTISGETTSFSSSGEERNVTIVFPETTTDLWCYIFFMVSWINFYTQSQSIYGRKSRFSGFCRFGKHGRCIT